MKKIIVVTLGLIALSVSAFAMPPSTEAQICVNCVVEQAEQSKNLNESETAQPRELLGKINQDLPADQGQSRIGDFIRNKDGSVKTKINQFEASAECKRRGSRLPTARELVKEAEKYGGKLLEVSDYEDKKIPDGFVKNDFHKVTSIENEKTDTFYYSYAHYQRPKGDIGYYWTWSSSLHPDNDYFAHFFFGGDINTYARYDRSFIGAARCKLTLAWTNWNKGDRKK